MPDMENVVGHLNDCMEASRRDNTWVFVRKDIVEDALARMKEQNSCENCAIAIEDRQPVVRCKDCIHWDKGHTEECDNSDSVCFHNGWCKPDWFCADGERKKEDNGDK